MRQRRDDTRLWACSNCYFICVRQWWLPRIATDFFFPPQFSGNAPYLLYKVVEKTMLQWCCAAGWLFHVICPSWDEDLNCLVLLDGKIGWVETMNRDRWTNWLSTAELPVPISSSKDIFQDASRTMVFLRCLWPQVSEGCWRKPPWTQFVVGDFVASQLMASQSNSFKFTTESDQIPL